MSVGSFGFGRRSADDRRGFAGARRLEPSRSTQMSLPTFVPIGRVTPGRGRGSPPSPYVSSSLSRSSAALVYLQMRPVSSGRRSSGLFSRGGERESNPRTPARGLTDDEFVSATWSRRHEPAAQSHLRRVWTLLMPHPGHAPPRARTRPEIKFDS